MVKETAAIKKKNGNTFWHDVITKDMKNMKIIFQILPDGNMAPYGFQLINSLMVFDMNMEEFRRRT